MLADTNTVLIRYAADSGSSTNKLGGALRDFDFSNDIVDFYVFF